MVTLENPVKHLSYIVKRKKAKVKLLVISNKERLKVFTFIAQHETPEEFAKQLLLSLGDPSLAGSVVPYQWDMREDFPAIMLSQLLPWVKGLLFIYERDLRLSLDVAALFFQNKSQAIYTYPTGQAHAPAKALKPSARQDVATLSFLDMAQAILDKKHNKASPKPSDAEKKKPSDDICERCRAEALCELFNVEVVENPVWMIGSSAEGRPGVPFRWMIKENGFHVRSMVNSDRQRAYEYAVRSLNLRQRLTRRLDGNVAAMRKGLEKHRREAQCRQWVESFSDQTLCELFEIKVLCEMAPLISSEDSMSDWGIMENGERRFGHHGKTRESAYAAAVAAFNLRERLARYAHELRNVTLRAMDKPLQ